MKTAAKLLGCVTLLLLLGIGAGAIGRACEDNSDALLDAAMDLMEDAE